MRCVNETRWPASLSCLRRPSIVVTASVRNEVAVGIDRLSSMYFASMPAPPRSGWGVASGAGAVAGSATAAGPPFPTVARTSAFVMRPPGPEPATCDRSTPSAAAMRAATGEILASDGIGRGATVGAPVASAAAAGSAGAAGVVAPAPFVAVVMRAMTWPTVTVSPSPARTSVIVPAAGAVSSTSILSVEISAIGWPSSTVSPAATCHSTSVPSETDSPAGGVTMSSVSPGAASLAGSASASASAGGAPLPDAPSDSSRAGALVPPPLPPAAAAPLPVPVAISASTAPTSTVSPSAAWIFATVPLAGAGTSASTLSVETSTRTSSASTRSPSCLCHSRTVPSVTDSPIWGNVTCTVVSTAMTALSDSTARFSDRSVLARFGRGHSRRWSTLGRMSATATRPKVRPLDPLDLDGLLSDEDRLIAETVRRFAGDRVLPSVEEWYEQGTLPTRELAPAIGELGLLGMHLSGYGCAGASATSYGVACRELEAADSGLRSFVSVQGSLAMFPIWKFGSDEQKERWLPGMAAGELIGCFGLTEPDSGSDPSSMKTNAKRDGSDWVLNGAKMWITNGGVADVAVVWARTDDGIRGFLVPRDTQGFTTQDIHRKHSLRASITSELVFDDVRLPEDAVLPDVTGMRGPLSCLSEARYGILWGVVGAARTCLDAALEYSKSCPQFGRPIAAFQLTQQKLVNMMLELQKAQLLALHVGRLKDEGRVAPEHISIGKLNNVREALAIAREARTILGANGISSEYPVMRHAENLESVLTYEGTSEIHTLILGQAMTGESAFA